MSEILCVLRSEATRGYESAGRERWCFGCRKRLAGKYYLMVEPPGSYYDPWWSYRCNGCQEDHRLFPGCEWEDGMAGPDQQDGPTVALAPMRRSS